MVIGIGALASLGLAMPTGLAFGYGYGYGVRSGYNAWKPSKNDAVNQLHMSPNPVEGAMGAGLKSAEEVTGNQVKQLPIKGLTDNPSLAKSADTVADPLSNKIWSPVVRAYMDKSKIKSHEDYQNWVKRGITPDGRKYKKQYKRKINRRVS